MKIEKTEILITTESTLQQSRWPEEVNKQLIDLRNRYGV